MTRFVGDAVGVRSGRSKGTSYKDIRKDMRVFQETGYHPELEAQKEAAEDYISSLPDRDVHRPHVFMDMQAGGRTLGRLLIEVFEELLPIEARHFITCCQPGSTNSFEGTRITRLIQDLAAFGGESKGGKRSVQLRVNKFLRHAQRGTVSIALNGTGFALALDRALTLDGTHQVIGIVRKGIEVLKALNGAPTDLHDAPQQRIVVAACGITDAQGNHETLEEAAARAAKKRETPEQAAARLAGEAAKARAALEEALESGLNRKRGPDSSQQPPAAKRRGPFDQLLDGSSDDDSSSSAPD